MNGEFELALRNERHHQGWQSIILGEPNKLVIRLVYQWQLPLLPFMQFQFVLQLLVLTHKNRAFHKKQIRLYLKNYKFLYKPFAWLINRKSRHISDAHCVVNMYLEMWSSNTLALQFILPLFCRELLREKNTDSHRHIWYFAFICALNLIPDSGGTLIKKEIDIFSSKYKKFPNLYWLQEAYVMYSMALFLRRKVQ
ncbi:MAG: hypothetical protein HQK54_00950 [Oligoflexales bacterium]|nr:hypothetical protein [Oligoflexales bacterium]